jgi:hypothetical protein
LIAFTVASAKFLLVLGQALQEAGQCAKLHESSRKRAFSSRHDAKAGFVSDITILQFATFTFHFAFCFAKQRASGRHSHPAF